MRALTIDDFRPLQGKTIEASAEDGSWRFVLAEVQELPQSPRTGGGFRLELHGPPQPVLPQKIYAFDVGGGRHDIFIVPIGANAEAVRYEAVFF